MEKKSDQMQWDDETDVLIAGSGGALCGAYTAAREGLRVTVVEAGDRFGGTTAYSGGGGMWFPTNPVLRRAGTDDTIDRALEYFHAVVGDRTPPELQETYVRRGAEVIEYLDTDDAFEFEMFPWPDYLGSATSCPYRSPPPHSANSPTSCGVRSTPIASGHRHRTSSSGAVP